MASSSVSASASASGCIISPEDSAADFALVMDPIEAFRKSQTLFAAVSLGVFDLLQNSSSGLSLDVLAEKMQSNKDAAERLLDACVGLQLLTYSASERVYRNSRAAETFLTSSSAASTVGYVRHSARLLYPMWGHLDDAVREGSHRWMQTFNRSSADMFKTVYATSEGTAAFMASMHSFGVRSSPAVVRAFPQLASYRHLVDIGGGTGHLAIEACLAYPHMHATVADLPPVLPVTQQYFAAAGDDGVRARLHTVAFDLFDAAAYAQLPAETDVFALGRILHDWDEETCVSLLRSLHARLPAGGAVLLAEKLLADVKSEGPLSAQLQSLNMLVQTKGKERSAREYASMLESVGFTNVQHHVTQKYLDAVIAFKP